jgi:rhodanese-related sulfurtransferase
VDAFTQIWKTMDLTFFAKEGHKIMAEKLFDTRDAVFLDVRSKPESESANFPPKIQAQCLHIPTDEIPDRLPEIPKDKVIGVFCSAGIRAAIVYAFLRSHGFENVRILTGGYETLFKALMPGQIWSSIK